MSTTFELSKRLYELRPQWYPEGDTKVWVKDYPHKGDWDLAYDFNVADHFDVIPAYTLEFLLERLPRVLGGPDNHLCVSTTSLPNLYSAFYIGMPQVAEAPTPLEAVLKLTIALIEAGLTPGEQEGGHK